MLLLSVFFAVQVASPPPAIPLAILNVPRLVAETSAGKALSAHLDAVRSEKQKAIAEKQAALQALRAKNGAIADVQHAQVELQRMGQDADAELEALNEQLQNELFSKVEPLLEQILKEDHIGAIVDYPHPSFILWVDPSIDITTKVIERLDAATKDKN